MRFFIALVFGIICLLSIANATYTPPDYYDVDLELEPSYTAPDYWDVDLVLNEAIGLVITIVNPTNTTYETTSVDLNWTNSTTTDWVGYSLNGASNITLTTDIIMIAIEGSNHVIVWANDTNGVITFDEEWFTVDTTIIITIDNPTNTTYTVDYVDLNWSVDTIIDWNAYSLDGTDNVSIYSWISIDEENSASFSGTCTAAYQCEKSYDEDWTTPAVPLGTSTVYVYENTTFSLSADIINWTMRYSITNQDRPVVIGCWNYDGGNFIDFVTLQGTGAYNYSTTLYDNCTSELNIQIRTRFEAVFGFGYSSYYEGKLEYTIPTQNVTLTGLSEGSHNITVWANTTEGIMNQSDYVYFTVDTEPPLIEVESPENITYDTQSIWFNVSSYDVTNVTEWCGYSLDGTDNISLSNSSGNWNDNNVTISEGSHYVNFYCNDSNGNMNSTDALYFTVDVTLPYLTIESPPEANTTINWFNMTAYDEITNIDLCWYSIDGGSTNQSMSNSSGDWNYQDSGLVENSYTAIFWCNDSAGNENSSTRNFTYDISYPVCTWISQTPSNLDSSSSGQISIIYNCTDNSWINNSRVGLATGYNQTDGDTNSSWRFPANTKAGGCCNELRQAHRNESRWYEALFSDVWTCGFHDIEDIGHVSVIASGNYSGGYYTTYNFTKYQLKGLFHIAYPLDKAIIEETGTDSLIFYKDQDVITEIHINSIKPNTSIIVYDYIEEQGSPKDAVGYFCNSSSKNDGLTFETSPNCAFFGSVNRLDNYVYSTGNVHYYEYVGFIDENKEIAGIVVTRTSYIVRISTAIIGNAWKSYYSDNTTLVGNVSMNNSGMLFTSADGGITFDEHNGSSTTWFARVTDSDTLNDTLTYKFYSCDNADTNNCGWTSVSRKMINVIGQPPNEPYITHIDADYDKNGTYKGTILVGTLLGLDIEGQVVTGNLSLTDTDGNIVYVVNDSYTNGYAEINISFDTTSVVDGLYKLNLTNCDTDTECSSFLLGTNFTIDNTPPTVTIDSPTNTTYVVSNVWFNVTTDSDVEWCGYSLNDANNQTLTNISDNWNYENSSVPDLYYTAVFYCNDTAGHISSNSISFTVDTVIRTTLYLNSSNSSRYYEYGSYSNLTAIYTDALGDVVSADIWLDIDILGYGTNFIKSTTGVVNYDFETHTVEDEFVAYENGSCNGWTLDTLIGYEVSPCYWVISRSSGAKMDFYKNTTYSTMWFDIYNLGDYTPLCRLLVYSDEVLKYNETIPEYQDYGINIEVDLGNPGVDKKVNITMLKSDSCVGFILFGNIRLFDDEITTYTFNGTNRTTESFGWILNNYDEIYSIAFNLTGIEENSKFPSNVSIDIDQDGLDKYYPLAELKGKNTFYLSNTSTNIDSINLTFDTAESNIFYMSFPTDGFDYERGTFNLTGYPFTVSQQSTFFDNATANFSIKNINSNVWIYDINTTGIIPAGTVLRFPHNITQEGGNVHPAKIYNITVTDDSDSLVLVIGERWGGNSSLRQNPDNSSEIEWTPHLNIPDNSIFRIVIGKNVTWYNETTNKEIALNLTTTIPHLYMNVESTHLQTNETQETDACSATTECSYTCYGTPCLYDGCYFGGWSDYCIASTYGYSRDCNENMGDCNGGIVTGYLNYIISDYNTVSDIAFKYSYYTYGYSLNIDFYFYNKYVLGYEHIFSKGYGAWYQPAQTTTSSYTNAAEYISDTGELKVKQIMKDNGPGHNSHFWKPYLIYNRSVYNPEVKISDTIVWYYNGLMDSNNETDDSDDISNYVTSDVLLNFTSDGKYGELLIYFEPFWTSSPENVTVQVGDSVDYIYQNTTIFNTSEEINISIVDEIKNYISANCEDKVSCNVPFRIGSAKSGILEVSNINFTYSYDKIILDTADVTSGTPIIDLTFYDGNITISGLNISYYGSKNITVIAHNADYSNNDTQDVMVVFSNFSIAYPYSFMDFLYWAPYTNNIQNVEPVGQSLTRPGITFTSYAYDKPFDIYMQMQNQLSCINTSIYTERNSSLEIEIKNDSFTKVISNINIRTDATNYNQTWLWRDYNSCNGILYRYYEPNITMYGKCTECV